MNNRRHPSDLIPLGRLVLPSPISFPANIIVIVVAIFIVIVVFTPLLFLFIRVPTIRQN
jgi:hypothetical protein